MVTSPFPGMDPYLEHPALWPDVHNRLIAAIADALVPLVAPRYYIGLERRTYLLKPDDVVFIGRPDIAVTATPVAQRPLPAALPNTATVLDVEVPMNDEVGETFLEVHEVSTGKLITLLEVLSPVNKSHPKGRKEYTDKRADIFWSRTNLVEIDLLRAGEPMEIVGPPIQSNYRVLVSRGDRRPHATLYAFTLRQPIPSFSLPLLPEDEEPLVELGTILHGMYTRGRFDLRLDYTQPPVPPLQGEDVQWAAGLINKFTP